MNPSAPSCPPAVEVRLQHNEVDEICADNCTLHIERMSGNGWYIGVTASDGSLWRFWLGAKNMHSRVDVRHSETVPAEPAKAEDKL